MSKLMTETAMPMQQGANQAPRDMALVMVWLQGATAASTFQAQLDSANQMEEDFERGLVDTYRLELYPQPTGRRTRVTFARSSVIAIAVDRASISSMLLHGA